jgi:hypothetical protein
MNYAPTAYPLAWPTGYKRRAHHERIWSKFSRRVQSSTSSYTRRESITVTDGVSRVMKAIKGFSRVGHCWRADLADVVISTNLRTRLDGLPASNQREPEDPGVAVYFVLDGKPTAICADRYLKVAENLAAVAATIEALRDIERHGATEADRAFAGFMALPEKAAARTFYEVLGIPREQPLSQAVIDAQWKEKAKTCHPDRPGGSHDAFTELNTARDQAITALTASQP